MGRYTKIEIVVPKEISDTIKTEVGNVTSKRALKKLVSQESAKINVTDNLVGDTEQEK